MALMIKDLVLTVIIRKEQGKYSSWCPEFDIASQGKTIEEARENLKEAVSLYVETVLADGKLNDILEKVGLSKEDIHNKEVLFPLSFSSSFEVPLTV